MSENENFSLVTEILAAFSSMDPSFRSTADPVMIQARLYTLFSLPSAF